MILLTCAVGKELAFFTSMPHVEMLVTGVGPVESGVSVARALAQSSYELVINAGIAGAFPGAADIGQGVVVSEEFMFLGLENGEPLALPGGARVVDRVSSDLALVDRMLEQGFAAKRGLTVCAVTATQQSAEGLAAYGDIESMEGFAVLRAAEMAGVAAIEVRGISNFVTDRAESKWNFDEGARGLEGVLISLLSLVAHAE
ncbi:MAG: futalosine hydrolase [Candidatus Meridianibacter frigidus]|nr:MAG: futalosine hydrolase [Candidatus Eremiobacteraeota bacterium]